MLVTASDWIQAGLQTLRRTGIDTVRVESLAKQLKVSKGSFYHHFSSRDELLNAMFSHWEELQTRSVIKLLEHEEESAITRLRRLTQISFTGDIKLQSAILAWAKHDPAVVSRLHSIETERINYLRKLFLEMGFNYQDAVLRAESVYLTYIGWVDRVGRMADSDNHVDSRFLEGFIEIVTAGCK